VEKGTDADTSGRSSVTLASVAQAQTITEIIDATGAGAGKTLSTPYGIAVDSSGNVYVTGADSDNAFKITPGGTITQIIDGTGDGAGKTLDGPVGIAVDSAGNVYVTGVASDNAFKIDLVPKPVPALNSLGMIIMAVMLPGFAFCFFRRRESNS